MEDLFKYFDRITFSVMLLFTLIGLALIYSASHSTNVVYTKKQALWILLALILFFLIIRIKPATMFKIAPAFFMIIITILLMQLIIGHVVAGVKSWIRTGLFNIQISELIKIPLALVLAKFLTKTEQFSWANLSKLALIVSPPILLIAIQPDFGTAFMLTSMVFMAIFLKGLRLPVLLILVISLTAGAAVSWQYLLKNYQRDRVISFLNPEKYRQSKGYQVIQSKIALGSGGLSGQGYLKGSQSQMKFLPTRHTDFILSVLGEEFGFLGISTIFILFFVFFYRQFKIKAVSDEEFYFIYLFNAAILFQFLINVLMSIGWFPILGVPLPFVSYGGSSLLTFFMGEALIFRMKLDYYTS